MCRAARVHPAACRVLGVCGPLGGVVSLMARPLFVEHTPEGRPKLSRCDDSQQPQ